MNNTKVRKQKDPYLGSRAVYFPLSLRHTPYKAHNDIYISYIHIMH